MINKNVEKNLKKIMKNGKTLILAYDQGLEHGPTADFNEKNVDPNYIIDIAKKGKFNALAVQKGIAEKYNEEIMKSKIPLIVKLNGKTRLSKGEPISEQLGTVKEAIKLGAIAVGYTIYIGSEFESEMLEDFSEIQKDAHKKGLPVILWIYPRGKAVKDDTSKEMMSYAARVGLEIGADIVKIKYNGKVNDLKWAVKSAGKTKVVIAGGVKSGEKDFLNDVKKIVKSGASGMAIGRNIWQSEKPIDLTKKVKKIIWK